MKGGRFERSDTEWSLLQDFYSILGKYYGKEPSSENYDAMTHELNAFMKKYGVKQVLKPQTEPVAALAHRLAIALADLAEDLRRADK